MVSFNGVEVGCSIGARAERSQLPVSDLLEDTCFPAFVITSSCSSACFLDDDAVASSWTEGAVVVAVVVPLLINLALACSFISLSSHFSPS